MKKLILFFGLTTLMFTACYKDTVEELYPGAGLFDQCDTTSVITYSGHITTLMQNYCYSCHSGGTPSSGFRIDTYTALQPYAASGELINRIHGTNGFNRMPPSFPLDPCQMRQFELWVNAGAPNN
ncbi:hypothetical protein BH11BAC7_BH11BAC7_17420 [soil metagenome]